MTSLATHDEMPQPFDDYSRSFSRMRGQLVDGEGVCYTDFVRGLKPVYWRVYLDIGLRYAAWVGTVVVASVAQANGVSPFIVVPSAAVLIAMFSPAVHIHEASHWNIASDRNTNDFLCNLLMSWIMGLEIKFYRKVHFDHHRHLGTVRDTERSYFFPLNAMFILKGIIGISVAQTLLGYLKRSGESHLPTGRVEKETHALGFAPIAVLASGVIIHGLIVVGLWYFGHTAASAAWLIGVGVLIPLLGSIRQILEHRMDDARSDIDYSEVDQGACTRIFGDGLFAKLLGASGFNHHLLHHWDPQIPYTRLPELERFLNGTQMRDILDRRRSTYQAVFRRLFEK
jgi:fatty acid desaturase